MEVLGTISPGLGYAATVLYLSLDQGDLSLASVHGEYCQPVTFLDMSHPPLFSLQYDTEELRYLDYVPVK